MCSTYEAYAKHEFISVHNGDIIGKAASSPDDIFPLVHTLRRTAHIKPTYFRTGPH